MHESSLVELMGLRIVFGSLRLISVHIKTCSGVKNKKIQEERNWKKRLNYLCKYLPFREREICTDFD
jgi:hypothetical protein